MAKPTVLLITVIVACAALVQGAPAWKQEVKEGLVQYLTELIHKADKNSDLQMFDDTELREQDLPMFNTKLREQDLPMFNTKLREQDLPMSETELKEQNFDREDTTQEVEKEPPTPPATAEELNTQILEKMSELKKLLEKKTQLLAKEQARGLPNNNEHVVDNQEHKSREQVETNTDEERNLLEKLLRFADEQGPPIPPPRG